MATQGAGHTLGERIPLTGPDGKTVEVEVVSLVEGGAGLREYLVDARTFDLQGGTADHRSWFVKLAPGADRATTMDAIGAVLPGARAGTNCGGRGTGLGVVRNG